MASGARAAIAITACTGAFAWLGCDEGPDMPPAPGDAEPAMSDARFREANDAAAEGPPDGSWLEAFPWKSGSRLRAKIEDGGEGAELLSHWYDAVFRFDCSFARASD